MLIVTATKRLKNRILCQGVAFLVLFLSCCATDGWSVDSQGCRSFDRAELDPAEICMVQHEPFTQKTYEACHSVMASLSSLQPESISPPAVNARSVAAKPIWLVENSQAETEHCFLLAADQQDDRLAVDLRGEQNLSLRQEINLPMLKDVEEIQRNSGKPKITYIKNLEVKRGVFLSVLIGWQTDVRTNAQVRYGNKNLSESSDRSPSISHSHQVRLYNLKPDEQYQFEAVSTDLFGRSQASGTLEFSTEDPISLENTSVVRGTTIEMQSSFQRLGGDYLLSI